jgi:hypothetical protein
MRNLFYTLVFLMCLLLANNTFLHAQNTGYGGKRFLVKTNVINGIQSPLASLELEYALSRRFSISIKGGAYKYKVNQRYNAGEYATPVSNYYNSYGVYSYSNKLGPENRVALPDKAEINSRQVELEFRYYPGSVIPAPSGFFTCIAFRYAKIDVKGNYYNSLLTNIIDPYNSNYYGYPNQITPETYNEYDIKGVTAAGYNIGLGYQKIYRGLISLGFKTTIDHTFFNISKVEGKDSEQILSGVAKNYGSNITTFSSVDYKLARLRNSDLFSLGGKGSSPTKMSVGLSFCVQVGVLF